MPSTDKLRRDALRRSDKIERDARKLDPLEVDKLRKRIRVVPKISVIEVGARVMDDSTDADDVGVVVSGKFMIDKEESVVLKWEDQPGVYVAATKNLRRLPDICLRDLEIGEKFKFPSHSKYVSKSETTKEQATYVVVYYHTRKGVVGKFIKSSDVIPVVRLNANEYPVELLFVVEEAVVLKQG